MAKTNQKTFAEEYIVDFNATQAAIRSGYSVRSAGSQGNALLKNPKVQKMITEAIKDRIRRTHITQERVVLELAEVAFAGLVDMEAKGIAWKDKLRALELLGKHLGMFDAARLAESEDGKTGVIVLPEVRDG